MKSEGWKISAMIACSIACMAGCMVLYHEREEQNEILQNMVSDFTTKDVSQINEKQTNMRQSLVNSLPDIGTKEQEAVLSGLEDKWQLLQIKWDIQKLLKEKEADSMDSEMLYEKYFRLKQGELARIEGIENLDECGEFPFLDSHFGGVILGMDESVWVQYSNSGFGSIWDYLTPRTIIVMDAAPQMGLMGTLAGMNFEQIQENLYETEVNEGFIYNEDRTVYYLQYGDEYYDYIFCSTHEDGSNSWLLIEHAWRNAL